MGFSHSYVSLAKGKIPELSGPRWSKFSPMFMWFFLRMILEKLASFEPGAVVLIHGDHGDHGDPNTSKGGSNNGGTPIVGFSWDLKVCYLGHSRWFLVFQFFMGFKGLLYLGHFFDDFLREIVVGASSLGK